MALRIATPKKLTLKIAGAKKQKRNVSAMTVRGVLGKLHVGYDKNDKVTPSLDSFVKDGDKVVFTKVTKRKVHVGHEKIGFDTVEREDDSMTKGETSTVREGRSGVRDVTYRVVTHNGDVFKKRVLKAKVLRAPVSRIVHVGTEAQPSRWRCGAGAELRQRRLRLGPDRRVRVRWQLGREHRQRLLRRAAVQPRHLAGVRRLRPAGPEQPRAADRRGRAGPRRRGRLRRLARVRRSGLTP